LLGALDSTPIVVSLISTIGVLGVGLLGYLGIKTQIVKSNDMNTSQHGEVAVAVRSMESLLRDVDATIGLLVSMQGFPLFKNTIEGTLIWANSPALELLGLPFDQLADPTVWPTIIHPDDRARVTANWWRQMNEGQPSPAITFRYVHPITGNVTKVRGMSRPVHDTTGDIREWVSMIVPVDDKEEQHAARN
jgi:PAS domain S-box-containing protein